MKLTTTKSKNSVCFYVQRTVRVDSRNDLRLGGRELRSFVTTQSVKQLPADLKAFALDSEGWRLP